MKTIIALIAVLLSVIVAFAQGNDNPGNGGSNTQTATSGTNLAYSWFCTVNPPSIPTAIFNCGLFDSTYTGPGPVVSGHVPVLIGHFTNNSGQTYPLGLGLEGKIDNTSGTITNAQGVNVQVASNPSGQTINNFFGEYCDVASNAGTIGIVGCVVPQIDANTGTITSFAGLYMQALTAHPTTLYGLYFANQGSGTRYAVYNLDASAPILTNGNIEAQAGTGGDYFFAEGQIHASNVDLQPGATGGAQTLETFTLPANSMPAGSAIEIRSVATTASNADSKTLGFTINGSPACAITTTTSGNNLEAYAFVIMAASNTLRIECKTQNGATPNPVAYVTQSAATTIPIVFQGTTPTATTDLTQRMDEIIYHQASGQ